MTHRMLNPLHHSLLVVLYTFEASCPIPPISASLVTRSKYAYFLNFKSKSRVTPCVWQGAPKAVAPLLIQYIIPHCSLLSALFLHGNFMGNNGSLSPSWLPPLPRRLFLWNYPLLFIRTSKIEVRAGGS